MKDIKTDIVSIIKSNLINDYSYNIKSNIKDIILLSNKLNISGFVCNYMKQKGIDDNYYESVIYKLINKYEIYKIEIIKITNLFNSNNIDFVFTKGQTLSKYYEIPYLRYSEDIDIVVKNNSFNKAKQLLIKELNFKEKEVIRKNEISLVKDNISIDLHYMFMKEDDIIEKILSNAEVINHELSIEYKYFYVVAHSYKHIYDGLFEYKTLFDLFYLIKQNPNFKIIIHLLNETKLSKYNECLINYLNCINTGNYDETSKNLEEFIFNMTIDKGIRNKVLINHKKGYIFKRIFLDYKTLSGYYPLLKKYPILLPVYEVKRLITIIANNRIKNGFNEINALKGLNKSDFEKIDIFKDKIGLK